MPDSLFISTLQGKKGLRAPFWFMRQAGRYLPEYRELRAQCGSFLGLCYNPELASEVTLQPITRYGMDAAILFSDILVVPHALGMELTFAEGEGPRLPPIRHEADLQRLSLSRVEAHVQPVWETVRRVRAQLSPEKALIGFAGSPWTVACYMVEGGGSKEFEHTRRMAYEAPELFQRIITLLEEASLLYLRGQIEAGAQAVQLFDSWAGILPPEQFARWVIAPTKRIAHALKASHPHIPLIGFPRLAGVKLLDYAAGVPLDGISIDHGTDMTWVRQCMQEKKLNAVPQGNLDPYALAYDLPQALSQASALKALFSDTPFIFNLGHGMIPQTPLEHVRQLCELLKA